MLENNQEKKQMNEKLKDNAQIHNVNFYNLSPRGIQCMTISNVAHKLALSRDDDCIEIWDIEHVPVLEIIIPTRNAVQYTNVGHLWECLVWSGENRLFSVGLNEFVVEWDLEKLQLKRTANITGNAIWCAATNRNNTELAVGTEEGYINILNIDDNELQCKKIFDKQNGRVLCCCYDDSGKYLVTGSLNTIRIWQVATGHALHKMSLAPEGRKKDVIVWCVKVLHDFSIVAGDSRGQLTVWDGNNGSQLETHQVLSADILSLALVDNQQQLVCSGVEPILRIYTRTKIRREDIYVERWIKSLQRSVHDHDVKALICDRDRIYSGGIDGYLGLSYMSRAKPQIHRYAPLYEGSCASVAVQQKRLLLRYGDYLEVWRLGTLRNRKTSENGPKTEIQATSTPVANGTSNVAMITPQEKRKQQHVENDQPHKKEINLITIPEKLLTMRTKKHMFMLSAAISSDGGWLCYSTSTSLRLFRADSYPLQLERIPLQHEHFSHCSHVEFSADSKLLFVMNNLLRQVIVLELPTGCTGGDVDEEECIELVDCIDLKTADLTTRPKLFSLSACGLYLAIADAAHTISVWRKEHAHFHHYINLPRYSAAVTTALNLQCIKGERVPRVLACFADGKFFEYHLVEKGFVFSANINDMLPLASAYAVTHVHMDERQPNYFFFQTGQELLIAKKNPEVSNESVNEDDKTCSDVKRSKNDLLLGEKRSSQGLQLTFRNDYEHFVQFVKINGSEYATIKVNPLSLIEKLSRAFKQKKFGIS